MNYRDEAQALDAELLRIIADWHRDGTDLNDAAFNDLALRVFAHQLRYDQPYARYCASLGITPAHLPRNWTQIPPVPAAAYKEAALSTDPARAALVFETSGTTRGRSGRHFMETPHLYDAALLAGFDRFMLPDGARLQYFNLVPNPEAHPHSSLGYMMGIVSARRGTGATGWYLDGDALWFDAFVADLRSATAVRKAVCIAGTAFAFVQLLDELAARSVTYDLPEGSRIMETGGFKGRTRVVTREELYAQLAARFGLPQDAIVAEYGMTELTSQYYDDEARVKRGPTWLRTRVVGVNGRDVPNGIIGSLVHVDLANRSSCVAVGTQDLGALTSGGGLVLLGREHGAELRGCSLDAELLRTHPKAMSS